MNRMTPIIIVVTPVPGGGDDTDNSGGQQLAPPVSSGPSTYIVKRGDTLSGIASQFNVSVNDLMLVNGLTSYLIFEGQQLNIPAR